eukprot:350771-Chlamydomonas_euryale.AAC.5
MGWELTRSLVRTEDRACPGPWRPCPFPPALRSVCGRLTAFFLTVQAADVLDQFLLGNHVLF